MTVLGIALAVVSISLAGASGIVAILAIRNGKLNVELGNATGHSSNAEKQLSETSREFLEYKRRTDAQLAAVRADVEELEKNLDECTIPGARRDRLNRLLGKLSSRNATISSTAAGQVSPVTAPGSTGDRDSGS